MIIGIALGDTSLHEPALADEVRRHVDGCSYCQGELAAYRRVVLALRAQPIADQVVAEATANVRRRVMAKVCRYERFRLLKRSAAVLGAAAGVVIALALVWSRWTGPAARPATQMAEGPAPVDIRPGQVFPTPAKSAAEERRSQKQAIANHVKREPAVKRTVARDWKHSLEEVARLREEGTRYASGNDYEKAQRLLRRAITLAEGILREAPQAKTVERSHYEQYLCYEALGEHLMRESSFCAYLRAIQETGGKEAAAWALLEDAQRLVQSGATYTSGERVERALALGPSPRLKLAGHVILASCAERRELWDLALSQYQAALDEGPEAELAARILGKMITLNMHQDRLPAALASAEALCALSREGFPKRECILQDQWLAHLYARNGSVAKAVLVLRETIKRYGPGDDTYMAQLQLNRIHEKLIGQDFTR
ncbi:MAG TPA: hypothetical protein P5532_12210 [Planctomycetota bacterium]|nr:hypothetical protein [Planctomycetota bacterium]